MGDLNSRFAIRKSRVRFPVQRLDILNYICRVFLSVSDSITEHATIKSPHSLSHVRNYTINHAKTRIWNTQPVYTENEQRGGEMYNHSHTEEQVNVQYV